MMPLSKLALSVSKAAIVTTAAAVLAINAIAIILPFVKKL
jgi:hypothetical protein